MGDLWLRIKVWTKVALFALLFVYVITFIFKNIEPRIILWVWYNRQIDLSVLLLALVAFVIGVLGTILSRTTFKTLRQVRQFNDALPCGTRLLRVQPHGRFVIGRFELTKRPQHSCPTRGQRIRVAFALQNGLIAEWRQLAPGDEPAPARPEGAPDPPLKLAA